MGKVIDPYYWISHYTYEDQISKNAIKKKIKELFLEYEDVVNIN